MPFFRRSLPVEEREAALGYYKGKLKVSAFHEKEADRYNEEAVRFQHSPQAAAHLSSLMQAAERLILASKEAVRRHASLESQAPPVATADFSSWHSVFEWTVEWSKANHEALRLLSLGQDGSSANARSYLNAVSEFQRIAEGKSRELLKHMQITQDDYARLLGGAKASLDEQNWIPNVTGSSRRKARQADVTAETRRLRRRRAHRG